MPRTWFNLLPREGELAEMVRVHDWSSTPLGPPERWPQPLRTLLSLMLDSQQPMFTAWGPERIFLYNDAYAPILGARHPAALGGRFYDIWAEIREDVGPILERAYDGQSTHVDSMQLMMERNGYPEETYFAFSYTPVRDESGAVAGMFCSCRETTEQVLAERRRVEEADRLRSLFEGAPNFVAALRGPEHRFEFANDAYKTLIGHRDVVGLTVREAVPEVEGQGFFELLDQVFTTGEAFIGRDQRIVFAPKAGGPPQERFLTFIYQPIVEPDGTISGIFVEGSDVTEGKRAQDAVRESEAVLRAFFETEGLYASVLELRDDGPIYLAANRSLSRFFRREDVSGERAAALIGAPGAARLSELLGQLGPHRRLTSFDHAVPTPAGERWFSATVSLVDDAQGRRLFTTASLDITERRRAEEALRDSEARFRAITETLPQIVWSTLPDGFHDYYNRRWYEFTGLPEGSTDGEGWSDAFHPDDQPGAWEVWRRSLETGEDYTIEYRLRHNSGVYRWVLGRARAVRDPDTGAIVRWMGTCTDIQEIVEAREVLSRSRSELQRLVEERTAERDRLWVLSDDMLARADYAGGMSAVSPAWTRVLGHSEEHLLSHSYADIIHPEDVGATVNALNRMGETRRATRFENRIVTADGAWRPIAWTVAPEEDGVHFIAVGRDMSAEKARERELSQVEEALRQAQKMEAVGQLTGGIAHDFNNLLQGILGSLNLVQKRIASGRTQDVDRFITGAVTSANRAAALTHRLLAFSRRQPLDPKPVKANSLVASMEDLLRRTLGESIALELVLAGGLWPTLCDPNQLESALLNLAINARDAMPGGGKLTIETCNAHLDDRYAAKQKDVKPGQYVCLCVTDTGSGMTPDVIERAFDPFFTTKPIGQGTGLGLSMIYGFARQSEGYAKIYSEVGQGTTVKLYLPRHRGEAEAGEEAAAVLTEAHHAEAGETVLVVEDEPVVRGLIVEVLGELGYRALEASDGPSGLEMLRNKRRRIDLLVTDIGLPGLNGRQLADAGRELRPELRVLFMTGYAENAALANGFLDAGMAMITKPFAMEHLATRIREMIEGLPGHSR